ncbi:MAG: hypothetical protein FD126_1522 [Elusimicrobia bacterium]|nr:MAG: hypothetical protein FD126_1522 [Elusimicrobiota bacterium]
MAASDDGTFIESGSFRVDREKALEKLERYQLACSGSTANPSRRRCSSTRSPACSARKATRADEPSP